MLSVANVETYHLNKEQMQELIHLVSHQDATDLESPPPNPKSSDADKAAVHKRSKSNATKSIKSDSIVKKHVVVTKSSQVKLLHLLSEDDIDESGAGCLGLKCPCFPRKQKDTGPDELTAQLWREKYCKTFEDFNSTLASATKHSSLSIPGFNSIKRELSYENDPTALGLSSFGGLMWVLTYGIQHLVDPTNKTQNLSKEMVAIRAIYQEIGSTAQKFVTIAEKYCNRTGEIHRIVVDVVKRLTKKYKFTKDPLYLRPEYIPKPVHLRKRVGYEPPAGSGKGSDESEGELFHVNWSPLTVVVQYPKTPDWEIFSALSVDERLSIYKIFVKYALATLQTWIKKFAEAVNHTSESTFNISKPKDGSITSIKSAKSKQTSPEGENVKNRSPLFEVATAMQSFMKSAPDLPHHSKSKHRNSKGSARESVDETSEVDRLQALTEDFWFTMDAMYELSVEIERLVHETRDAVRTCYIYATQFYQWKLTNYDTFDPKTKTKEYKANQQQIKAALAKILGQRRFSDAAMFISLADFTSSIYQKVAQNHEYSTGGYTMKLNSWDDEEIETWGLLSEGAMAKKK